MTTTWVRAAIGVGAWVATSIGATGIALHVSPSSARVLVLAASGAPYLMVCALFGVLAFSALGNRAGVAVAGLVVVGAAATQAPLYIGDADPAEGPVVHVMQTNILFGGVDAAAVVTEVRDRNIGLLTVDELSPEALEALEAAGLGTVLPHRHLSPGPAANGTGIWSAYPLSDTVEYDGFVMSQVSATAEIPGAGPVGVYAFHPVPPVVGTDVWADELSRLHDILEQEPGTRPAVVGADFNATYDHSQFRVLLSGRFGDATDQVGAGHLRTYPTDKGIPPVVGIDHILVAGGSATEVETVSVPGSDHRAVVAQLRLDGVPE
ncbi:endonuclease/exonuclease/phosphatase family protein [Rhodococcus sp. NPDC060084]|uniref:endonuclease/exonuclease/phosphatase family protein n=1 Tax=Rhodococcus sp. NPDC060084 TaxID=3347053 RepID=UPI0036600232